MSEIVLDSVISRVTVYREGAMVERTARIGGSGGEEIRQITIGGLPACLDDDSVRVSLRSEGSDGSSMVAQDFMVAVVASDRLTGDSNGESIREEIRTIKIDLAGLAIKSARAETAIDRLLGLTLPDRPRPDGSTDPTPNPTAARLALDLFLSRRREELREERNQLLSRKLELEERLLHLQLKLDEINEQPVVDDGELTKAVHLHLRKVNQETNGDAQLRLSYLVPGAHWYPSYSLFATADSSGELAMHAVVGQHTGEAWDNVELRLSTAHAQQWTELPELQSLRIGKEQRRQTRTGWRAAPVGTLGLFADYDQFKRRQGVAQAIGAMAPGVVRGNVDAFDDEVPMESIEMEMEEDAFGSGPAPEPAVQAMAPVAESRLERSRSSAGAAPSRKLKKSAEAEKGMADIPAPRPSEVPITEAPGASFLDYRGLQMPPPDAAGRGSLQPGAWNRDERSRALLSLVSESHALAVDFAEPVITLARPESFDGFDFAYECATPVTIPSQRDLTGVAVLRQDLAVSQSYVTVPREGPEVYRMARVTNPLENPLPAGPIDIYRDGEFFVTARLDVVAPRGQTDVGLGVEQGVKVARNTVFAEKNEGGILGGTLYLRHEIEIDIINNLDREAVIEVRERVPVTSPEEDDARVEISDVEPPWKEFTGEDESIRGGYSWELRIPAGGESRLKAHYRIRISARNELIGGNRREA